MRNVYVVTTGEYSDYSIRGVFDNEPQANEFAESCQGEVKEYPLNPTSSKPKGYFLYRVEMDREGNSKVSAEDIIYCNNVGKDCILPHNNKLLVYCWARNDKHAVKIANEKRAKMIVMGEWDA